MLSKMCVIKLKSAKKKNPLQTLFISVTVIFHFRNMYNPTPGTVAYTNLTSAEDNVTFYLTVYGILAGANTFFTLARAFLFAYGGICAAQVLHNDLLSTILKVSYYSCCQSQNMYCTCPTQRPSVNHSQGQLLFLFAYGGICTAQVLHNDLLSTILKVSYYSCLPSGEYVLPRSYTTTFCQPFSRSVIIPVRLWWNMYCTGPTQRPSVKQSQGQLLFLFAYGGICTAQVLHNDLLSSNLKVSYFPVCLW